MKENVALINEIQTLRIENKEEVIKKGPDDEKKSKNEPSQEMIRNEITDRRRAIVELQDKIAALESREEQSP